MSKRWLIMGMAMLTAAASASAQTVATDPLQCWWRTSAAGVRVGQPFSVVLTCAVVETDTVTVVPDQAPLEPTVMQLPPFEVLGGTRQADLRTDDHRFFQYEYRLRLVAEDSFGKDVKLPDLKVSYHLQSRTGDGPAIDGRELTYILPPISMRVLSLVPADETDIRDATSGTFGDVESRAFRANLLRTSAGVLFALAGLTVVVALVRLFGRYRTTSAAQAQIIPDVAILHQIGREFSAIGRERRGAGWTPALVDRLVTALRITGAYALSRRVIQMPVASQPEHATPPSLNHPITQSPNSPNSPSPGHLVVATGWMRGKKVVVAGSVTPESLRHARLASEHAPDAARRSGLIEELERALGSLTLRQYGRAPRLEDRDIDDALDVGVRTIRRVTAGHSWLNRKLASLPGFGHAAWSR